MLVQRKYYKTVISLTNDAEILSKEKDNDQSNMIIEK